jgi:ribose transport system substrate-binding protein
MRSRVLGPRGWCAAAAAIAALSVTACGSSSSDTTSRATTAAGGGGGGAQAAGPDVAAAKQLVAPYTGKPSPFPVDQPLPERLPGGTKMAYVQCASPICGIFSTIFPGATKAIGASFSVTKAGASSQELQTAFASALETKPTGILLPAIEPRSITTGLADAKEQGIPISANGIMDGERYGIGAQMLGRPTAELAGKLLAGWVVAEQGADAKPVFYATPELSFSGPEQEAFVAQMKELCAACDVRVQKVPVATIGNAAPTTVVSDLQSHPDTSVAVFATQEASTGLPAALKTAGIEVDVVGFAPNPANLADIKSGAISAGLGLDLPVMAWTQVDALARLILHAPLTAGEKATIPPMQFLTAADLTGDVSQGWTGYPDFAAWFAKLWNPS